MQSVVMPKEYRRSLFEPIDYALYHNYYRVKQLIKVYS